jgi:hypothetical protein
MSILGAFHTPLYREAISTIMKAGKKVKFQLFDSGLPVTLSPMLSRVFFALKVEVL